MSDSWLQLVEEFIVLDLVKFKVVSFLRVQFYGIIQLLAHVFTSTLFWSS